MNSLHDERTVWLVRHGESTWNASGLVQGQAEGPVLSETGRRQAEEVADVVRRLPIGTFITSDLSRATETASIIGDRLGMDWVPEAAMRERNFGAAEGSPLRDLSPEWSGFDGGRVINPEARPPGGETLRDLSERVRASFVASARQQHEGDVLVVTHGGVIRMALAICDRVPFTRMAWASVPNASLWSLGLHELCPPMQLSST